MRSLIATVLERIKEAFKGEDGTDLIEYVLLIHFLAFGATAGSMPLAKSIGGVFNTVNAGLATAVSGAASSSGSSSGSAGGEDAGAGSNDGGGGGQGAQGSGDGSGGRAGVSGR